MGSLIAWPANAQDTMTQGKNPWFQAVLLETKGFHAYSGYTPHPNGSKSFVVSGLGLGACQVPLGTRRRTRWPDPPEQCQGW